MEWPAAVVLAFVVTAGVLAAFAAVHLKRHLHSRWKIWRAGPRRLLAMRHRIWREPRPEEAADLRHGPGGAEGVPVPPFAFVEEQQSGSQPCVSVRDARGRLWRAKWGEEAKPESFAVRVAWACGYFAEVTHYVPSGTITGVGELTRARDCIDEAGAFHGARFELEDRSVRMLFEEHSWSWDDNPFTGTPQLSGLKMVAILLSNWDTKDRRDVSRGSNTAIFEHPIGRWRREARYLITDWGGAMGRWGSNVLSRGRWDVEGFEAQTAEFVADVRDGHVAFGYKGQRTAEIARDIPIGHVRWFHHYASRLTEPALREALLVCGATSDEAVRFARALVTRIRILGDVAEPGAAARRSA